MKKFFTITFFTLTILSFVFTLAPITTVFSADYVPLSPLPDLGADKPIAGNFSSYLTGIYKLAIGIAGVLAVMVILFEGIKHMASESFVAKADTSARIGAAVGGLLLALGAYVILYAINPKLVEFNLVLSTVPDAGRLTAPQTTDQLTAKQLASYNAGVASAKAADKYLQEQKTTTDAARAAATDACATNPTVGPPSNDCQNALDRLSFQNIKVDANYFQQKAVAAAQKVLYSADVALATKDITILISDTAKAVTDLTFLKASTMDPTLRSEIDAEISNLNNNLPNMIRTIQDSIDTVKILYIAGTIGPMGAKVCPATPANYSAAVVSSGPSCGTITVTSGVCCTFNAISQ